MKVSAVSYIGFGNIQSAKKAVEKTVSNTKQTALMTSAASSAIAASAMVKTNNISLAEIEQKLLKNGFEKDISGNLIKNFTAEQDAAIKKDYGYFSSYYKRVYNNPIDKDGLQEFKKFLDIDKSASRKMADKDFDKLFFTYSLLKKNNLIEDFTKCCQENKSYYKLFENLVNNAPNKEETKLFYKHKLDAILGVNEALREKANNINYVTDEVTQKVIDDISSGINKQVITNPIKLYRGEGLQILENVKLKDGSVCNLAEMMTNAAKSQNPQEIEKVKKIISDNKISVVQPGFMSTSLNKEIGSEYSRNGITWELETLPNTKGVYMEGINIPQMHTSENEVFLQKGSKMDITSVEFDERNNSWKLKANVSN